MKFWPLPGKARFYPDRQLQTYRKKPSGRWPPQQPKPVDEKPAPTPPKAGAGDKE
jgi:hypothetical protein